MKTTKTTAKTETTSTLCKCGCGETLAPKRTFRQGHDARFAGRIVKLNDGRITWKDIEAEIQDYAIPHYEAEMTTKPAKTVKTTRKPKTAKMTEDTGKIATDLVKTSNLCHAPLVPVVIPEAKKTRKIRVKKADIKAVMTATEPDIE